MKKITKISSLLFIVTPLIPWISITSYKYNSELNNVIHSSKAIETKKFDISCDNNLLKYSFSDKVLQDAEIRMYYSDTQSNEVPISSKDEKYSIDSYCVSIKNSIVNYPLYARVIDSWWGDSGWAVGPRFWDSLYYNTSNGPDYSYHMANREIVRYEESATGSSKRIFNENLATSFSGKHNGVYRYRVTQFNHGEASQNPFNSILLKTPKHNKWISLSEIGNSSEYGGSLENEYLFDTYNSFRSLTELKINMISPKKGGGSVAEIDLGLYDNEIYLAGSEGQIQDFSMKDESYKKYDIDSFYNSIDSVDDFSRLVNINLLDMPKGCISDSKGEKSSIEITKDQDNQKFVITFTTANSFLAPLNFNRDEGSTSNSSYEINETEWINEQPLSKTIELPFNEFTELISTDVNETVKKEGISITGILSSKLASEIISATPEDEIYLDLKKWISQNSEYIFVGYPNQIIPIENILSIKRSSIPNNDSSVKIGITLKDALEENISKDRFFEFNINGFLKVTTDLSNKEINIPELSNIPLSSDYISENKQIIVEIIQHNLSKLNIHVPPSCKMTIDLSDSTFTSTISGVLNNIKVSLSEYYNSEGNISNDGEFILDVSGFALINPIATFNPIASVSINNNENVENINEDYLKKVILNSNNIFKFSNYFPLTLDDITSIKYNINKSTGKVVINSISYKTYNDKGEKVLNFNDQLSNIKVVGFSPDIPWYDEYFYILLISGIVLLFLIIILIIIFWYRHKNKRSAMRNGLSAPLPKRKINKNEKYIRHNPPHIVNEHVKYMPIDSKKSHHNHDHRIHDNNYRE